MGGGHAYEVWTLHCPPHSGADSSGNLQNGLKGELEKLGATLTDEGGATSQNPGNSGDSTYTLNYTLRNLRIAIRITFLPTDSGSVMVVTVDQTAT